MAEPEDGIRLEVGAELQETLENRLILLEDVRRVIAEAERTRSKLVNQKTGHFLAHFRPVNVTYWVEYSPLPEAFRLHDAYSHRMRIVEKGQG